MDSRNTTRFITTTFKDKKPQLFKYSNIQSLFLITKEFIAYSPYQLIYT